MQTLELAEIKDLDTCYGILDSARDFQREQGFIQWDEDYPTLDLIRDDIQNSKGYVVKVDGKIAGYMCITLDGEPAYKEIDGKWREEKPYVVVHRLGFAREFRGIGLADITFNLIDEFCLQRGFDYIRVDTYAENKRMQHILIKNGFVNCGTIFFQGGAKMAFDKKITRV